MDKHDPYGEFSYRRDMRRWERRDRVARAAVVVIALGALWLFACAVGL